MDRMTHHRQSAEYDVIIVGSGAGGGMAAYMLTRAGARVALLEAGGPWDNATDGAMMRWNYETPVASPCAFTVTSRAIALVMMRRRFVFCAGNSSTFGDEKFEFVMQPRLHWPQ